MQRCVVGVLCANLSAPLALESGACVAILRCIAMLHVVHETADCTRVRGQSASRAD